MKPLRFYEHFAAAYGTIWLVLMLVALISNTHINAGLFGLIGFPILSLAYAFVRKSQADGSVQTRNPE
jgi:cbb3-type cytochrome oxidase subunit 3